MKRAFMAPVNLVHTGASNQNNTVWSMRVATSPASNCIIVERIYLSAHFYAATPLARSVQRYTIAGFATATPSGGTSITPLSINPKNTDATIVTDCRQAEGGLTVTNVNFSSAGIILGVPAVSGVSALFDFQDEFSLEAGQGMCLRLTVAAIDGQSLTGFVKWREKS